MALITKHQIFGEVQCHMYTVERQKRGLPHAHILVWLTISLKASDIDSIISDEIPDKNIDPELHDIIIRNMVHGPCGALNKQSPCMDRGKGCTKEYPKQLRKETQTSEEGYPLYRSRDVSDGGHTAVIRLKGMEVTIDNKWIVPYCPLLSKTFDAHINVEMCNTVHSIKYITKYINKGSDQAMFSLEQTTRDEIEEFRHGRYVSADEGIWRTFRFSIHGHFPPVQHLAVHLENGQCVYFQEGQNIQDILETARDTTLTAFFKLNEADDFAQTLLYTEVPQCYTWNKTKKQFDRRKRGIPHHERNGIFQTHTLARMYTIHPRQRECSFVRLLLTTVRGPKNFIDLRTVNGEECEIFHMACEVLGLLEADTHWEATLEDAVITDSPSKIRHLFAVLIAMCTPSDPMHLWNKFKDKMALDILHRKREEVHSPLLKLTDDIYNEALIEIEEHVLKMSNQPLEKFGLPSTNRSQLAKQN